MVWYRLCGQDPGYAKCPPANAGKATLLSLRRDITENSRLYKKSGAKTAPDEDQFVICAPAEKLKGRISASVWVSNPSGVIIWMRKSSPQNSRIT